MPPKWALRTTDPALARRYRADGQWTDDTLGQMVDQSLRKFGFLPFRVWSEVHPFAGSFADVEGMARRLAGALAARGVGPGDVVSFQFPNWVEAAATFWGASMLGAVLVPVVHIYGPRELGYILRESGARAHLTADRFGHLDYEAGLADLWADLPELEVVVMAGPGGSPSRPPAGGRAIVPFDEVLRAEPLERAAAVDPDQPALLAYTSGTTANPKGVVHTHRSLMAEVHQLNPGGERRLNQLGVPAEGEAQLVGSPVSHATGMLSGLLSPLLMGRPINLLDRWDPARVLSILVEADLSLGGGAAYFLTSLLDHPSFAAATHIPRLRWLGLGGSPVPETVTRRASALGISIVRSYGSTEHPSITGSAHADPEAKRLVRDGRAMPGVEMRIVDVDGHDVAPGEPGEIVSRGPELFAGYTDPVLTAAVVDAGGWYHTGDVGVVDAEGWLTITDRLSDVIIRGGENISAAEVEAVLSGIKGVAEVAVVAAPDDRMGEHPCAFVRLVPGAAEPALDDLRRHLEGAGLARQKWPEELHVVDEFERTPSGKIKKYVLRQRLRGGASA